MGPDCSMARPCEPSNLGSKCSFSRVLVYCGLDHRRFIEASLSAMTMYLAGTLWTRLPIPLKLRCTKALWRPAAPLRRRYAERSCTSPFWTARDVFHFCESMAALQSRCGPSGIKDPIRSPMPNDGRAMYDLIGSKSPSGGLSFAPSGPLELSSRMQLGPLAAALPPPHPGCPMRAVVGMGS